MTRSNEVTLAFRAAFGGPARWYLDADYAFLSDLENAHAACTRAGEPALVIPLSTLPQGATGRRTAGCELLAHPKVRVDHGGSTRDCPAAALVCHDSTLLDAFSVLVGDVITKIGPAASWSAIATVVDEWLTLLAPKGAPSPESELGLWGELWFLTRAANIARLLEGWRGPEGDSLDFFLNGVGAEVKTSRVRHRHHCSQSQVGSSAGDFPSWVLSIWVKRDALGSRGHTVPAMVDQLLASTPDRADVHRRLARAGYSPADRTSFNMNLVVLEEPGWFASRSVPQVRVVDPGVSKLRYQVDLQETQPADAAQASRLWNHFHGRQFETQQ